MTTHGRISEELLHHLDPGEADSIDEIGERLYSERPVPRPGFRAQLVADLGQPREPWRPERLGLAVGAYVTSGLILLAVAALGLAGSGPLAP